MREIKEMWFGGYGLVPFGPFAYEPNTCMLPSGQRTLAAPQAHGGGLAPKISTPKQFLCFG